MRFPKNKKYIQAFTLVELLVVISVIGLLMAILVPVIGKTRGTANRTYCKANLRQIGVAFRSYLDDNRDIFPLCCSFPWLTTDANDPMYAPPITKVLGPLLKESKVFICKSDTVNKYYLKVGNTSYSYNGRPHMPPMPDCDFINGLGGKTIRESCEAKNGVKEKNIAVMNDFDDYHPISGRANDPRHVIGINYLYADWHVADIKNQE
jgi:prepilin-type N-terminal cleavage/methylation domain-containing protein/prepilin-type processing-associated H-X9-DG protein